MYADVYMSTHVYDHTRGTQLGFACCTIVDGDNSATLISGRLARLPYTSCHNITYFAAPCKAPHCFGRLARRPKRCLIISVNRTSASLPSARK